jgi:hypothetical protein
MTGATTAADVARWMLEQVQTSQWLDQDVAVFEIEKRFGSTFVHDNENGNPAIDRSVLKEFKAISRETVVWERGDRAWRLRGPHDAPGRQQD